MQQVASLFYWFSMDSFLARHGLRYGQVPVIGDV